MQYRKLPETGVEVSVIALGSWAFAGGGNWGPQDDRDSIATVHAALSHGINLIDTAEAYGDGYSEEVLGRALEGRREDVVIATKPSSERGRPEEIVEGCNESLKRLKTDYIDLYQQHWPNRDVPFEETMHGFQRLKEQGKIRAFGVCNYGPNDLSALLPILKPATNQVAYSLIWRAIEHEVQPTCEEQGIGILPYSPIAQGLLTGKYRSADEVPDGRARTKHFSRSRPNARHGLEGAEQATFDAIAAVGEIAEKYDRTMLDVSIGWLLSRPAVTSVLAGARTPDQLKSNAAAGEKSLPEQIVNELSHATHDLREKLGADPDPWAFRMQ